MKIKIISLILTFVIVFSIVTFPAYASTAYRDNIINLMSETNRYIFTSGSTSFESDEPYARISGRDIQLFVDIGSSYSVDVMYFSLDVTSKPDVVEVYTSGVNSGGYATLVGSYNGTYNYKIAINEYMSTYSIILQYRNSTFDGEVFLSSCFGAYDSSYSLTHANIQTQVQYYYPSTDKLGRVVLDDLPNVTLPHKFYYDSQQIPDYDPTDETLAGLSFVYINGDSIPFNYADSVTFFFDTCGSVNSAGVSIINNSGSNYLEQVPYTLVDYSYSKSTSSTFPNFNASHDFKWPLYFYSLTVDLSGIDLSDKNLMLFLEVDPIPIESYDSKESGFTFNFRSIIFQPTIESVPWYARFGNWITGGFNSVISWLSQLYNGIQSWFASTWNKLTSEFIGVKNTISQWGQNIVDALTGTNSDAEDALDQSDQISGELGDVNQEMNDLEKPDLDNINPDLENAIPGGLSTSYSGFLAAIIQNPILYQVIGISLLISFAGYVLYGKR